jgi:hypothetical protein
MLNEIKILINFFGRPQGSLAGCLTTLQLAGIAGTWLRAD